MAWLDGRPDDMVRELSGFTALTIQDDPEALFLEGWLLCDVGEYEEGLDHLRRAVAKSYFPVTPLSRSPHFDALRGDATFQALLVKAEAGRLRALEAFREAGGDRLLGR